MVASKGFFGVLEKRNYRAIGPVCGLAAIEG